MNERPSTPVVIVSNDTHIGPRLVEDLRPYCPNQHLDEFDRFAADAVESKASATQMLQAAATSTTRTSARSGTTTRQPGWPTTTTTASLPACCSTAR